MGVIFRLAHCELGFLGRKRKVECKSADHDGVFVGGDFFTLSKLTSGFHDRFCILWK